MESSSYCREDRRQSIYCNPAMRLSMWVASSDRIRTGLGYEEPVEIEEAIRRTIAWEQQNPPSALNPQHFDYGAEDAALANVP